MDNITEIFYFHYMKIILIQTLLVIYICLCEYSCLVQLNFDVQFILSDQQTSIRLLSFRTCMCNALSKHYDAGQ
jgi:hypothetical protein